MKDPMRREPLQLVLWTPRQLHLMQPGRQEAADLQRARSLRAHSEYRPHKEPWWVHQAYEAFWEGKEWGSGPLSCEDDASHTFGDDPGKNLDDP